MKLNFKDREVEVTDYEMEIGEGAYVTSAQWMDTGKELTDDECEQLSEHCQSDLYQEAYEWAASDAYDRAKDAWKYGDD